VSTKERILVVSGIYPPDIGGPATYVPQLCHHLVNEGFEVSLVSLQDKSDEERESEPWKRTFVLRNSTKVKRIFSTLRVLYKESSKCQAVFANGLYEEVGILRILRPRLRLVAKIVGDPVWERARNSGFTDKGIHDFQQIRLPLKYRIFRWIYTKSLQRAKCVIVPSDGLRKLCIEWGIDSQKIQLTYNSVDTDFFVPVANHGYSFDLITACRLTTWKRVDELIELAAQMGLRLAIAGDGPERTNLEALSKSLSANVVFFGELEKEKLLDLFHRSKYFLLNSEYEGLPHVLIEARAAGIFTFARSGTGSSEVIHGSEDGFIYEDIVELQKVMNYVEMNPKLFISMKNLARLDTLNRFNKNQNFIHILDRVIQKS
jgi:glycosyltransferase involved in cell wall biosynthesis